MFVCPTSTHAPPLFITDVLLDPGYVGEAPGLPVPLESGSSKKKGTLCVLGISNSCCHVGYRGSNIQG